jgi:excinuclease ABC subunit C
MFAYDPKDYPAEPGVYFMKDAKGRVIYVGKAKRLRARLGSYFRKAAEHTAKTRALVNNVAEVDYLLTSTEKEALLLEASLIKKHRPRYNIVLRDDKQYILLRMEKKPDWPRLVLTRRVVRDGSVYFGPFTSAAAARETWKVINSIFPLRKCTDRALANRVRPCLYHYIGNCLAPCVEEVDREQYARLVQQVEMLLRGRADEVLSLLETQMWEASESTDYERAAMLRDRAAAVRKTVERQSVVVPGGADLDVAALVEIQKGLGLGLLFVRQGRLVGQKSFSWLGVSWEDGEEVLASFLGQFYDPGKFIPRKILTPFTVQEDLLAQVLSERRGGPVTLKPASSAAEKKLLSLARQNAKAELSAKRKPAMYAVLQKKMRLANEPRRIECVDVSHLGGGDVRAGVVVFQDDAPKKDDYRVYALAESEGSFDDYRALADWVGRRLESGPPWPDLLLIDGGRGQLNAVTRALEEAGAAELFELAAISKGPTRAAGELADQVWRPGRKNPLPLMPGSPELLFLQRIRDTAHSFTIGRQRRARKKTAMSSQLEALEGVGPKTARILWDHFGSLAAMASASEQELRAVPGIGAKRAKSLHKSLCVLAAPEQEPKAEAAAETPPDAG